MDPWSVNDEVEALSFELQGEIFALEAGIVQEILDVMPETQVPGAPPFVGGVINFRGKVIPLADLSLAFGMDTQGDTIDSRIVVVQMDVQGEPTLIGLRTDKVHEVTTLASAASKPPPSVGMRWRPEFIRRLIKRDQTFIVIPDLTGIFAYSAAAPDSRH